MTHLQFTPEDAPAGTPESPDSTDVAEVRAPGDEDSVDEMHLAQEERLERFEIERAADEGMTGSPTETPDDDVEPGDRGLDLSTSDGRLPAGIGFEEER